MAKKMNKVLKQVLILVCLIAVLILPYFVFAQGDTMEDVLREVGDEGGYETSVDQYSASAIAGTVVKAFLGLLGIFFIILILYAGYNWMTAQGEEEKINKAKDTIKTAIIGLVIVVGAWSIYVFIIGKLIISNY